MVEVHSVQMHPAGLVHVQPLVACPLACLDVLGEVESLGTQELLEALMEALAYGAGILELQSEEETCSHLVAVGMKEGNLEEGMGVVEGASQGLDLPQYAGHLSSGVPEKLDVGLGHALPTHVLAHFDFAFPIPYADAVDDPNPCPVVPFHAPIPPYSGGHLHNDEGIGLVNGALELALLVPLASLDVKL
jgi:hypothetical protein